MLLADLYDLTQTPVIGPLFLLGLMLLILLGGIKLLHSIFGIK